MSFVSAGKHNGPAEAATELFVQLPRLQDLLQFSCGSPYLPSHGLIKISFCNSSLPDPKSYFSTVNQLLLNNDYQSFMTSMNTAIIRKHQGYNQG